MIKIEDYPFYGIKKAVGEFNRWQHGSKIIMVDYSSGNVWCDCFVGCNSWTEYHSSDVKAVVGCTSCYAPWSTTTIQTVKTAIARVMFED